MFWHFPSEVSHFVFLLPGRTLAMECQCCQQEISRCLTIKSLLFITFAGFWVELSVFHCAKKTLVLDKHKKKLSQSDRVTQVHAACRAENRERWCRDSLGAAWLTGVLQSCGHGVRDMIPLVDNNRVDLEVTGNQGRGAAARLKAMSQHAGKEVAG